jgi:putative glycosyltransferase (TIGR04372 family)
MIPARSWDLFYISGKPCNKFFAEKCKQYLNISEMAFYCYENNKRLHLSKRHQVISIEDHEFYREKRVMARLLDSPQNIFLNEQERQNVEAFVKRSNMVLPERYVCFFNRDGKYLKANNIEEASSVRHDYRNSSIERYLPAMRRLCKKGIYCIRIGSDVETYIDNEEGIIDLSGEHDNEAFQLYLIENAQFIVGTTSGLGAACKVFRKDVAYVNVSPLMTIRLLPKGRDLFIPKKYWSREHGRVLTFSEIIASGLQEIYSTEEFDRLGIDLMENSEAELAGLVEEMELRRRGEWVASEIEVDLKDKFYGLLDSLSICRDDMPAIGVDFLVRNRNLLQA